MEFIITIVISASLVAFEEEIKAYKNKVKRKFKNKEYEWVDYLLLLITLMIIIMTVILVEYS